MKKKRRLPAGLIAILLIITAIMLLVKHFHIRNFRIITPDVLYTSGQPRGMDYTRLLYKYHIATIVNIRSPSEHREHNWYNEEITWARSNGVRYIEMPIKKNRCIPDEKIQSQYLAIMADKNNLPVLLHGSNDDKRVAMLVAVWVGKNQQYSVEQTIKIAKGIIDDKKLTEEELKFIADQFPAPAPTRQDVAGP